MRDRASSPVKICRSDLDARATDAAVCNPARYDELHDGDKCTWYAGLARCEPAGLAGLGERCHAFMTDLVDDCGAGLFCFSSGTCAALCSLGGAGCGSGQTCKTLNGLFRYPDSPNVGICL